jgi:hypothetical protein
MNSPSDPLAGVALKPRAAQPTVLMVAPVFMAVQSEAILLVLPEDMHLIVGLETQTVFPFDQEIYLDVKYSMLREDHWDEAERIVDKRTPHSRMSAQLPAFLSAPARYDVLSGRCPAREALWRRPFSSWLRERKFWAGAEAHVDTVLGNRLSIVEVP